MPGWMHAMDRKKPGLAPVAGAGAPLTYSKNVALAIAGMSAILSVGVSLVGSIVAREL